MTTVRNECPVAINVSMKDVNALINKVDALETLVVRYHKRFVSIHSRLQCLEKQTHFMKLESLSMRFKNRKAALFPPCQRIISTLFRSVYNPYHGQLLNGSNSKYDRQSHSPTCSWVHPCSHPPTWHLNKIWLDALDAMNSHNMNKIQPHLQFEDIRSHCGATKV